MPLDPSGKKWACEHCIDGHRATKCQHWDRVMQLVSRPGRPLSSCPHAAPLCGCKKEKFVMMRIWRGNECLCTPAPHQPHLGASPSQSSPSLIPSIAPMVGVPFPLVQQQTYHTGYPSAPPYFDPSGQPHLLPLFPHQGWNLSLRAGNHQTSSTVGKPTSMEVAAESAGRQFSSLGIKPDQIPNYPAQAPIQYSGNFEAHDSISPLIKPDSGSMADDTTSLCTKYPPASGVSSSVSSSEPSTPFMGPMLNNYSQDHLCKYQPLRRQSTPGEVFDARSGHLISPWPMCSSQENEANQSYSGPWLNIPANGPVSQDCRNPAVPGPTPPFFGTYQHASSFQNPVVQGPILNFHDISGLDPTSITQNFGNCQCGPQCSCYMCATHPYNEKTVKRVEMLHRELQSQLEDISEEGPMFDTSPETRPSEANIFSPRFDPRAMSPTMADPSVMINGGFPLAMDANYMDVMYPSSFGADPSIAESCSDPTATCHCGENCACVGCLTHSAAGEKVFDLERDP